jgi:hypothetical protein
MQKIGTRGRFSFHNIDKTPFLQPVAPNHHLCLYLQVLWQGLLPSTGFRVGTRDAIPEVPVVALAGGADGRARKRMNLNTRARERARVEGGERSRRGWGEEGREAGRERSHQGWQRRADAVARGADLDSSDGGTRRRFQVGGVHLYYQFNIFSQPVKVLAQW